MNRIKPKILQISENSQILPILIQTLYEKNSCFSTSLGQSMQYDTMGTEARCLNVALSVK
jgi:hypothetical protein